MRKGFKAALAPAQVIRGVLWVVLKLLFRVRVEGRELVPAQGGALLVANHVSFADPMLVGYCTPRIVRFLMWRPYFELPVLRYFFRALHAIPIAVDSPKSTVRALQQAREALREGHLVAIFPEGGVSETGETGPFERGFERVVQGTGAAIIPMHIEGVYGHPLSKKGGGALRSWDTFWRTRVTIRIGEPIPAPVGGDAIGRESISPDELRLRVCALGAPATAEPARVMVR